MPIPNTKLLNHPIVTRAYEALQDRYNPAYVLTRELRAGEVLSTGAKNPDPAAVAACLLTWPEGLKKFSLKAAEYAEQYFALETNSAGPLSEGAKQVALAKSIAALEDIAHEIKDGKAWKYAIARQDIAPHEKNILAAADSAEQFLAQAALKQLDATKAALEDLVRKTQAAAAFEKTGLPDHPTLRAAYALILADEQAIDPLFTNRSAMGADIAKILIQTGASSDPDVLGAAVLNQYRQSKRLKKKFSARLMKIHREMMEFNIAADKKAPSAEATLISHASGLYFLELELQEHLAWKNTPRHKLDAYAAYTTLENMEYAAKRVAKSLAKETHSGLKARMEKALASANAVMNAPENLIIRKPGTPLRDPGW